MPYVPRSAKQPSRQMQEPTDVEPVSAYPRAPAYLPVECAINWPARQLTRLQSTMGRYSNTVRRVAAMSRAAKASQKPF